MATRVLIEIAVDSLIDAQRAAAAGADRLELCAALDAHGLTPAPDLVRAVKGAVSVPVMAMVRARPGSFVCGTRDIESLVRDAETVLSAGADGVVFGALTRAFEIHGPATATLVTLASGRQTVFHRAFDLIRDRAAALETLATLHITRVLSAGQTPSAAGRSMGVDAPTVPADPADSEPERMARVRQLVEASNGRIEVMPGGGVRAANAPAILRATGATQLHSSCRVSGRLDVGEIARLRAAADGSSA